jgi:benzoyl-CoA 2,3-dioxygenase component A
MSERVQQRLVDPELCSACYGCHEVCPKGAIVIENRRVAVDPALCELCGECVTECATGAIDTLRPVPGGSPFGVEEQLGWDSLPPEELAGRQ